MTVRASSFARLDHLVSRDNIAGCRVGVTRCGVHHDQIAAFGHVGADEPAGLLARQFAPHPRATHGPASWTARLMIAHLLPSPATGGANSVFHRSPEGPDRLSWFSPFRAIPHGYHWLASSARFRSDGPARAQ